MRVAQPGHAGVLSVNPRAPRHPDQQDDPAPERRATAYGVFAGVQGVGALVGGVGTAALYQWSLTALVVTVAGGQVLALLVLLPVLRVPTLAAAAPAGAQATPG